MRSFDSRNLLGRCVALSVAEHCLPQDPRPHELSVMKTFHRTAASVEANELLHIRLVSKGKSWGIK